MVNTKALMSRLGGKLSLPSLPGVVMRVQEKVTMGDTSVKEVGQMIAQDPPLSARILRIANSAFYSLATPVLEITHAATILGMDTLQSVVWQVAVADMVLEVRSEGSFKPSELWDHSVLTAQLAASFPPHLFEGVTKAEVYVAGLLHDIGKFVMFDHLRSEFADTVLQAKLQGRPLWQLEDEVFGFNHAEVGELVAKRWGLPAKAVRTIGRHHDPNLVNTESKLVAIVASANHIALEARLAEHEELKVPLPQNLVDRLNLSDLQIEKLVEKAFVFMQS